MTDEAKDQAVHWALRQRAGDMDEAEWDAFTDWLEDDPAHAALMDEVQAADDALGQIDRADEPDANELPPAANDNPLKRLSRLQDWSRRLWRYLPFGPLLRPTLFLSPRSRAKRARSRCLMTLQ